MERGCWTEGIGRRPMIPPVGMTTLGDDFLSSNHSPCKSRPPLCHPERSRGICSSADHSWIIYRCGPADGCDSGGAE